LFKKEKHKNLKRNELLMKNSSTSKNVNRNSLSRMLNHEESQLFEMILPTFEMPNVLKELDPIVIPPSLIPPNYKDFIDNPINKFG
jgi:hypothetical protein